MRKFRKVKLSDLLKVVSLSAGVGTGSTLSHLLLTVPGCLCHFIYRGEFVRYYPLGYVRDHCPRSLNPSNFNSEYEKSKTLKLPKHTCVANLPPVLWRSLKTIMIWLNCCYFRVI